MTATDDRRPSALSVVLVRLDAPYRSTPEAVGSTLLRTPTGGTVALSQLLDSRRSKVRKSSTTRTGGGMWSCRQRPRSRPRRFVADVRRVVSSKVAMPDGYYVTYGGQFENQARATKRLAIIVPLVLLLIAGLLYASFGTVRHALLVMLNVPFALVEDRRAVAA